MTAGPSPASFRGNSSNASPSCGSTGIQPGLAFVRVGEDPASKVYVGRKEKSCAELGIYSETKVLPEHASERELLSLIAQSE